MAATMTYPVAPPSQPREHRAWPAWLRPRPVVVTLTVLILVYLILVPLGFLIYGSFSTASPGYPGVLTIHTYSELLSDRATWSMVWTSLLYGAGSSAVALVIGGTLAWLVQRTDVGGKRTVTFLILFPMFIPQVLTALAWVQLLDERIGVFNIMAEHVLGIHHALFGVHSLPGMIWVTGISECPLIFLWLWPAFAAMDPSLEEAASMAGRSPLKVLATVTLPLLRPAILAAFLVSFVLSLEDIVVPVLIGGQAHVTVFANAIYDNITQVPNDDNAAAVQAVILLVLTFGLAWWQRRLIARGERFVTVRGRGFHPHVIPLRRWRAPATILVYLVLLVAVAVPFLILIWTSLTRYVQTPSWSGLHHLTGKWYSALFSDDTLVNGLRASALVGLGATLVVMLLSLVVGWVLVRSRYRFTTALDVLSFAPIAIPGLVTGFGLVWVYLELPINVYDTLYILVIAYVTRFIPYGVRLVSTGFMQLSSEMDEAAAMSGSGWGKIIRTVSLPLLRPAISVGLVYVFVRSFTELSASLLLFSTNTQPYSVVAYNLWSGGQVGLTAAYGMAGVVVMGVAILVIQLVSGRGSFVNQATRGAR